MQARMVEADTDDSEEAVETRIGKILGTILGTTSAERLFSHALVP